MHKYPSASIKTTLYELVAGRKVFQEILVVYIVDLHDFVREAFEQRLVQWESENRKDMGNSAGLQRLPAA